MDSSTTTRRKFLCPEKTCGRRFNRKYTLTEHMKTHTGEKPFVCRVRACGRRFSTSGNLMRHRRLHGPLEPLACPASGCGKTFSTTGNLNRHLKNHHSKEERLIFGGLPLTPKLFSMSCWDGSDVSSSSSERTSSTTSCQSDSGESSDSSCDSQSSSSSPTNVEALQSPRDDDWTSMEVVLDVKEAVVEPWPAELLDILGQLLLD